MSIEQLILDNPGLSDRRIAKLAGVSHTTIGRLRRGLALAGQLQPPPARLKFPTDNDWGIPTLDPAKQATAVTLPVLAWGSVGRGAWGGITWHCFVDDLRIEGLWRRPESMTDTYPAAIVEPDYSILADMSLAEVAYQVYRKRWIARYWQFLGYPVYVSLNAAQQHTQANFAGVPANWRAFATRGYADRLHELNDEFLAASDHCGGPAGMLFLVVGGGRGAEELAQRNGWVWASGRIE